MKIYGNHKNLSSYVLATYMNSNTDNDVTDLSSNDQYKNDSNILNSINEPLFSKIEYCQNGDQSNSNHLLISSSPKIQKDFTMTNGNTHCFSIFPLSNLHDISKFWDEKVAEILGLGFSKLSHNTVTTNVKSSSFSNGSTLTSKKNTRQVLKKHDEYDKFHSKNEEAYLNMDFSSSSHIIPMNLHRNKSLTSGNGESKTLRIEDLPSKKHVHLCNAHLFSVSSNIGRLARYLKVLSLCCNSLSSIPDEIGELPKLKALYLSNNNLTSLPKNIGNLKNLVLLELQNNKITEFPKSVKNLISLRYLFIGGNQITWIPPEIIGWNELEILDISNNPNLKVLPVELVNLKSLRIIETTRCSLIEHFPNSQSFLANQETMVRQGQPVGAFSLQTSISHQTLTNSGLLQHPANWVDTFFPPNSYHLPLLVPASDPNDSVFYYDQNGVIQFKPVQSKSHPSFPIPSSYLKKDFENIGFLHNQAHFSDNPFHCPFPSLKEMVSRQLVNQRGSILGNTPVSILNFLKEIQYCSFCNESYFESWTPRMKYVVRGRGPLIPVLYCLCKPHWNDYEEYCLSIFNSKLPLKETTTMKKREDSKVMELRKSSRKKAVKVTKKWIPIVSFIEVLKED